MPAIRNSAKAIIINDGKLLCVECADSDGSYYILPGGGQEHGETLIDALRRECLEEVSVDMNIHGLRFIREYLSWNHEFRYCEGEVHQIEFMFLCTLRGEAEPGPGHVADSNQTGVAWLPLEQLNDFRLYPLALRSILSNCLDANGQEIDNIGNSSRPSIYLGDVN